MLDPRFVFLGAALGLVGSLHYAWATGRGRVRPNLVTWALWAAAPGIGFLVQLDSDVGLASVLTLSAAVGPVVVLLAVGRRAGTRVSRFDLACGAVSAGALVVWLGLGQAPAAVLVAVAADAVAAVPTVVKAWRHPQTESAGFYALIAANGLITLLTIDHWTPQTWAFPGYLFALGLALVAVIRRPGARAAS